jgi:hypothetical protein
MALEDRGRLPWAPVRLSEENIEFDRPPTLTPAA